MRASLCFLPLLAMAGCSSGEGEPAIDERVIEPGLFAAVAGEGGVCIEPDNAGFVFTAEDGRNCMAQGQFANDSEGMIFVPRGDGQCKIPVTVDGDTLTFGDGGNACSFYCASDLELAGRSARRTDSLEPITDAAGDLVC